jgi:ABC-type spermidine/putrescine transport system permease subunit II
MTIHGYGTAATSNVLPEVPIEPTGSRPRRARDRGRRSRWIILTLCGIYFIGPLLAAISFTLQDHQHGGITFQAYKDIFKKAPTGQIGFSTALVYSLEIAAFTIVLTLALMLPTQLLLHLRFPRVRPIVETITLLPLVFPPIVLVVGVDDTFAWVGQHKGSALYSAVSFIRDTGHPLILAFLYVMLAMPFVYRSLDAGIRSIDAQTLVEASRNLGAGWLSVLFRVILPSLRTAVLNAAFLCFALVMGEYTISSILLYTKPFAVWLYELPTTSGQVQAAVSVFSLLLVEVLLLVIGALNWRRGAAERKG